MRGQCSRAFSVAKVYERVRAIVGGDQFHGMTGRRESALGAMKRGTDSAIFLSVLFCLAFHIRRKSRR